MQEGQCRNKDLEDFPGKDSAKVPANLLIAVTVLFPQPTVTCESSEPRVLNQEPSCPPRGHLAVSGDIFGCHNGKGLGDWVLLVMWVEAGDAAQHPTMHRTAPQQKDQAPNVHNARVRCWPLLKCFGIPGLLCKNQFPLHAVNCPVCQGPALVCLLQKGFQWAEGTRNDGQPERDCFCETPLELPGACPGCRAGAIQLALKLNGV